MKNRRNSFILFIALLSVIIFHSCTSDNYEDYYADLCDTTNVTYSNTIFPILDNNCLVCHTAGSSPREGVVLSDYESLKEYVDNGKLLSSIKHESEFPMPPNRMLNSCSITLIELWINNGAKND